jgi:hypothetical protein
MAAATAALLVLPAGPAFAQTSLISPDDDVTEPTPLEVRVERRFTGEPVRQVKVTLRRDEERLGQPATLTCVRGCEDTDRRMVFALPDDQLLDPATGSPFGLEAPLANGPYDLAVEIVRNSQVAADETFEHELHVAAPPTAPKELRAARDGEKVELTWRRSPEPDVETYRVERHDGEDWEVVHATSNASHVDDPGEGSHRYRVVAERPDGRDGMLETASQEATIDLSADDDSTGTSSRNGDANGDRDGNGDGEDGANGEGSDADDDGSSEQRDGSSQQRNGSRNGSGGDAARAPSLDGNSRSGSIPSLDGRNGGDEEGFSEELDYRDARGGQGDDDVVIANPGGWRGAVDRVFDAEQVAVPIAFGLVLTATGLHLWRWLRLPVG